MKVFSRDNAIQSRYAYWSQQSLNSYLILKFHLRVYNHFSFCYLKWKKLSIINFTFYLRFSAKKLKMQKCLDKLITETITVHKNGKVCLKKWGFCLKISKFLECIIQILKILLAVIFLDVSPKHVASSTRLSISEFVFRL